VHLKILKFQIYFTLALVVVNLTAILLFFSIEMLQNTTGTCCHLATDTGSSFILITAIKSLIV